MYGRRGMKKAAPSLIKGQIHGRGEVSPGSGPTVPVSRIERSDEELLDHAVGVATTAPIRPALIFDPSSVRSRVFGSSPAAERLAGRHDGELSSEGAPTTRQEPARRYPPPGGLLSQFWFVGYLLLVVAATYFAAWIAWYCLFRGTK